MDTPLIIVSHHNPNHHEARNTMNPNTTYHVIDTATVNGRHLELRRLDTGNASAYLVVVNPGRRSETVANFGNRAHAVAAFDMATEAAYATR